MLINVGGGGKSKLTGTATAADVVAGKTFYNTDSKEKLTGSMSAKAMPYYASGTKAITSGSFGSPPPLVVSGLEFTPVAMLVQYTDSPNNREHLWFRGREGIGVAVSRLYFSNVSYGTFTCAVDGNSPNKTYYINWEAWGK